MVQVSKGHWATNCPNRKKEKSQDKSEAKEKAASTANTEQKKQPLDEEEKKKLREEFRCFICKKKGHIATHCPDRKIRSLVIQPESQIINEEHKVELEPNRSSNDTQIEECVEIPVVVNGLKLMALLDTGANVSAINAQIVHENNWTVVPRSGTIKQVASYIPRVGIVRKY